MNEPAIFSLSEAARITGKSKGTISKALSTGRLSYRSRENGQYQIDAAELYRVFPANRSPTPQNERSETGQETTAYPAFQAKLDAAERLVRVHEETIADLRRRLDAEAEERRRLTMMLTDQRQPVAVAAPESPLQAPGKPVEGRLARAWRILRGRA